MKSQKVGSVSGVDYISALPDNLVEYILLKLPLRDAARTCVLSKGWRYSWVKLPVLNLDTELFQQSFRSLAVESRIGVRAKFAMIISQILEIHEGPITDFRLDIDQLGGSPDIDSLIKFLSRNEIKTFHLLMTREEAYKLPSSIFTFQSLNELHLWRCEIPLLPSTFRGFPQLEILVLYDVIISRQQLQFIVSNCPSLQKLMLAIPVDILHLGINSASLTELFVSQHIQTINYVQLNVNMPLSSDPFGGLPSLQTLHLDSASLRALFAGGVARLLTSLEHLSELVLRVINLGQVDQLSCVLCLLKSVPNLQKLQLRGHQSVIWNTRLNLQLDEDYSNYNLNSLKEVTMDYVLGGSSEMKLIKLLLAKSPSLQKLTIALVTSRLADNGLAFFKQMAMFKHAASNVEVCFYT